MHFGEEKDPFTYSGLSDIISCNYENINPT